jgi:hypothetical protein
MTTKKKKSAGTPTLDATHEAPTLDALAADPTLMRNLSRDAVVSLAAKLTAVQGAMLATLGASRTTLGELVGIALANPSGSKAPAPTKTELASLEKTLRHTSILNWDCLDTEDIKQLARNVRAISALALLAYTGMNTINDDRGSPADDHEAELVGELLDLADHAGFILARKLGAVEGLRDDPKRFRAGMA